MNKKVLFLSYDGMTDPLGQSQVIPYLEGLQNRGFQISIISFEKPDKLNKLGGFIASKLEAAGIRWHPLKFHSKPRLVSKWYDIQMMKRTAFQLHKVEKFDLIHCRSYISADVGLDLKRKTGVKMIFDMRGFWADEKAEGGSWNKENFFWKQVYGYYKRKEKELIRDADHIISLTEAGKKAIQSWSFYTPSVPVTVIPCCADTQLFSLTDDDQRVESKKNLGISADTFVLSYLGSVGAWYMLDEMLAFYSRLLLKFPDSLFLFISNSDPNIILSKIAVHGLTEKNVRVMNVNYQDVPAAMKASDLSISFIKPVFSKTASSPTKIGETMCMGIPVVSNDIGDCGTIIRSCNAGYVVRDFSISSYDEVIEKLSSVERSSPGSIRERSVSYYGLEQGVQKYFDVYTSLFQSEVKKEHLQPA